MKKLLAITVLTLLGAGFAAAQTPQEMGNTATPGATFATGVVISTTADTIVIRKDSGEALTLFVDPATVGGHNNAVGSRIQANYRVDQGRAIATEIRGPAESATASLTPAPEPEPTVATAPPPAPLPAPMAAEDTDVDVAEADLPEPQVLTDEETEESTALPATASKGPAFALLGLLALGGAVAVRVAR